MKIPARKTLVLTHHGRRSGKAFRVTIWFADMDGELWIGSLDRKRNWVRNLESGTKASVDFGQGPLEVVAQPVGEADQERYREAVRRKYPVASRIIAWLGRGGTPAVFRLSEKG